MIYGVNLEVMLEKTVNRIKEDIVIRYTFLGTLIVGLISQGMGLFNTYSSHDDAIALFSYGETYGIGRWLTDIIFRLAQRILVNGDGTLSLPLFNGLMIIVCVAISACFAVKMLDIRDSLRGAFIGGIMVCVPTITCFFGYRYNAAQYGLGVLFAAMGAYYICMAHHVWGFIIGALILGCSAGIYQGFMPFALSLILFWCIGYADGWEGDRIGILIRDLLIKPALMLLSVIFYFLMNKLYLLSIDSQLLEYRGIDSVAEVSVSDYLLRVLIAYKQFIIPTRETLFYIYPSNIRYVYYFFGVIGCICMVMLLIRNYRRSILRGVIVTALFALIPLATNFMIVLTGTEYMYSTMTYSQMMPFVVVIYLFDRLCDERELRYELRFGFGLLCAFLLFLYSRYDSKLYMIDDFSQQETISYFNTLITRIQSTDGYKAEYPVCYIDEYDKRTDTLSGIGAIQYYDGIRGQFYDVNVDPYWMVDERINNYAWRYFMNNWCGYYPEVIPEDEFADDPIVQDMPRYPDQGSIRIIDDTVVINF